MKNLIVMMNAMKRYNHDELMNEEGIQDMLRQDVSAPTYRKLVDMVHNKHFRFIKRK